MKGARNVIIQTQIHVYHNTVSDRRKSCGVYEVVVIRWGKIENLVQRWMSTEGYQNSAWVAGGRICALFSLDLWVPSNRHWNQWYLNSGLSLYRCKWKVDILLSPISRDTSEFCVYLLGNMAKCNEICYQCLRHCLSSEVNVHRGVPKLSASRGGSDLRLI